MIAVIGCLVWAAVMLGGMTALGLWLERDYQRGAELLAEDAQSVQEALEADALAEQDRKLLEIIAITNYQGNYTLNNSTTGDN